MTTYKRKSLNHSLVTDEEKAKIKYWIGHGGIIEIGKSLGYKREKSYYLFKNNDPQFLLQCANKAFENKKQFERDNHGKADEISKVLKQL